MKLYDDIQKKIINQITRGKDVFYCEIGFNVYVTLDRIIAYIIPIDRFYITRQFLRFNKSMFTRFVDESVLFKLKDTTVIHPFSDVIEFESKTDNKKYFMNYSAYRNFKGIKNLELYVKRDNSNVFYVSKGKKFIGVVMGIDEKEIIEYVTQNKATSI